MSLLVEVRVSKEKLVDNVRMVRRRAEELPLKYPNLPLQAQVSSYVGSSGKKNRDDGSSNFMVNMEEKKLWSCQLKGITTKSEKNSKGMHASDIYALSCL